MLHRRILGGILFVLAAVVLLSASPTSSHAAKDEQPGGPALVPDDELLLPDGRPLPDLPIRLSGRVENSDMRVVDWDVQLATKGNAFEGKITFPHAPVVLPLTLQGTRDGDIVEFFVSFGKNEVAYFSGHLAGTNLVGTYDGLAGEKGSWSGLWIGDSLKVRDEEVR